MNNQNIQPEKEEVKGFDCDNRYQLIKDAVERIQKDR